MRVAIDAIEYDADTLRLLSDVRKADALRGERGNAFLQQSVARGIQSAGETGGAAGLVGVGMAGSMIGRQIGQNMDDVDRMKTAEALNSNRTGQSTTWTNPDNGREYTVTPTRTYEEPSGAPCREFELDATVGGEPGQEVNGTACLQPDGSWKIVG